MAEQLQFVLASLDFPGRTVLYLWEIAERLGVSVKHLLEQVDSGKLGGLDVRSAGVARRSMRIPIEAYHRYVMQQWTGPADVRMEFLRDLPTATRLAVIRETYATLNEPERRLIRRELAAVS